MSKQEPKFGFEKGHRESQWPCTGGVVRSDQTESCSSLCHGDLTHYNIENHLGRNKRSQEQTCDSNVSTGNYTQNWPKTGRQPEGRKSLESEIDTFRKQISKINIDSKEEFAEKLSPGNNGQPVSLLANFFSLKIAQPVTIHHYSVFIESLATSGYEDDIFASLSTERSAWYRHVIVEEMLKCYRHVFNGNIALYDCQQSLYSKVKYNFENESNFDAKNKCIVFNVMASDFSGRREAMFLVKLSYIDSFEVDMNSSIFSESVVKFIDLLLRYGPSMKNVAVGNKIFTSQGIYKLSGDKQLAIGFSMNVQNCECGLLLNVDRVETVFHTSISLIDFCRKRIPEFDEMKAIPADKVQEVSDELQGLYVKVSLPNDVTKLVRVCGLTKDDASKCVCNYEIKAKDNTLFPTKSLSVDFQFFSYFKINSTPLRHPHYPCVISGNEYYPLEVCELLGDQKAINDDDLKSDEVASLCKIESYERFNEINNTMKAIQSDCECCSKEFGVSISPENVLVTGRVLKPPSLLVAHGLTISPDVRRYWNIVRPFTAFKTVDVKKWILVYVSKDGCKMFGEKFMERLAQKLIEASDAIGMKMHQPTHLFTHNFVDVDKLKKDVFEQIPNLQLIIFLITPKDKLYNLLKQLGNDEYGVPTKCLNAELYSPHDKDNKLLHFYYLRNMSLRINAKLHGVNWILKAPRIQRTMIIGINVEPFAHSSTISRSIMSCVGTVDENLVKHGKVISIKNVGPKVLNVKAAITKLFESYKKNNNCFPDSVIVYRIGEVDVSLPDVLATEVASVKDAFMEIGCEAKASYIYIQNSYGVRLLPVSPQEATTSWTLPPGVVVDTVITHPALHTFFLCSNFDFQGTVNPPYYSLVFDENNFTADQIQQITNDLCYLHPFSGRALALPAPVEIAQHFSRSTRERLAYSMGTKLSSVSARSVTECEEYSERIAEALLGHDNIEHYLYFV